MTADAPILTWNIKDNPAALKYFLDWGKWNTKDRTDEDKCVTGCSTRVYFWRPICGAQYTERGRTLCGRPPNHGLAHWTSLYRERNGTIRESYRCVWFETSIQLHLFSFAAERVLREFNYSIAVEANPYKLDILEVRQEICNEFYKSLLIGSELSPHIQTRDDLRGYEIDWSKLRLSVSAVPALQTEELQAALVNPDLPIPQPNFTKEYLTQYYRLKEKLKAIDEKIL